jgi:hypothetical protein
LRPDVAKTDVCRAANSPPSFAADENMRGNRFSVEVIHGSTHPSSHLDALNHAQRHGRVYGGAEVAALLGDFGWRGFGAETIPPMVLPGVLIDVAASLDTVVENISAILSIPCLETIFFGPADLAGGYGYLGYWECPGTVQKIMDVRQRAPQKGIGSGLMATSLDDAVLKRDRTATHLWF